LLVEFETSADHPFKIGGTSLVGWFNLAGNLTSIANLRHDCADDSDPCVQTWLATVTRNDGLCTLSGDLNFNYTLICSDSSCSPSDTYFTLSMAAVTLCDDSSDDVDATKELQKSLILYSDMELQNPQSQFSVGDLVFASVDFTNSEATIDSITLSAITLSSSSGSDDLLTTGVATLVESTTSSLVVNFTLNRATLTSLSDLTTDESAAVTLSITVDVEYHGNSKRSTTTIGNKESHSVGANLLILPADDNAQETEYNEFAETSTEEYGGYSLWSNEAPHSILAPFSLLFLLPFFISFF